MADKDHHQAGTSQPEKCMTDCSNMVHNLEFHMRTLDNLCRTCGNRALTFKQKMNKSHRIRYVYKYTKLIADYFGIDPSADCVTVHPDKICSSCYNGMMTYKRSPKAVVHQVNRATAVELEGVWTGYKHSNSVDSCAPCLKFIGQMKGGRPKAVSVPKRLPFDITMDDIFNHLYSNEPIIDTNSFYFPSRTEAQKQNDTCQVCKSVFPLRTVYFPACEHMFCSKCVSTLFKVKLTSEIPCPTCRTITPFSQICKPNLQITTRLRDLVVACSNCNKSASLEGMVLHICQGSTKNIQEILSSPSLLKDNVTVSKDHPFNHHPPMLSDVHNTSNEMIQEKCPIPEPEPAPVPMPTLIGLLSSAPLSLKNATEKSPNIPVHRTPLRQPAIDQIKEILDKPINTPLTNIEERVLTSTFKRKLYQTQNDIIQLRTGGQPLSVQRLIRARKRSSIIHSPLKRKRARLLDRGRKYLSGEDCTAAQMSSELKRIPIKKRITICARAGVKRGAHISKHLALAIKSHVGLSWNQRRRLQHMLREIGISQENETAQRQVKRSLLGNHIDGKMINFEFRDESAPDNVMGVVVKQAPYVFVRNIKEFLFDHLERSAANDQLDWHQDSSTGCLPLDKIILKIGGDKGRGSMKMCMQLCNVKAANSPENTKVVCAFEANDTYANLAIALDGIAQQLDQLDGLSWEHGAYKKQIHLIGSGDYEFLAKIIGIAGASGTYPCIYCKINRNEMQQPQADRAPIQKRTLEGLSADYMSYATEGNFQSKNQAKYFNTINPALLNLEPERYSLPYLHCLLGITKKHHELQEIACHGLDLEIAAVKSRGPVDMVNNQFQNYVKQRRQLSLLETKYHNLNERLQESTHDSDDITLAQILRNHAQKKTIERKMNKLAHKITYLKEEMNLDLGMGPVANHIENVLQKHNIQRQKYHGKSFIGNDCHKYLSTSVYSDVCGNIASKCAALTDDPNVRRHANSVAQKFRKLWQLFAAIHTKISHAHLIQDDEIPLIHQAITQYFLYFREQFPNVRITTKQHLLEDHALDWIIRYRFGFGLFGEQGMESIHHKIRLLADNHHGITNPLQRLKATIEEHHLHTIPEIKAQVPPVKKRK